MQRQLHLPRRLGPGGSAGAAAASADRGVVAVHDHGRRGRARPCRAALMCALRSASQHPDPESVSGGPSSGKPMVSRLIWALVKDPGSRIPKCWWSRLGEEGCVCDVMAATPSGCCQCEQTVWILLTKMHLEHMEAHCIITSHTCTSTAPATTGPPRRPPLPARGLPRGLSLRPLAPRLDLGGAGGSSAARRRVRGEPARCAQAPDLRLFGAPEPAHALELVLPRTLPGAIAPRARLRQPVLR